MRLVLLLSAAVVLLCPKSASAQGSFGLYGVRLSETVNGESSGHGLGARAELSFPVFPLSAYATGERIFPDCQVDGCSVWGAEAGLNLAIFPFPIIKPYLSGAVVRRRFDSGVADVVDSTSGISVGAGVSAGIAGIRGFVEGRFEFMDDPYDQFILRLGVMF